MYNTARKYAIKIHHKDFNNVNFALTGTDMFSVGSLIIMFCSKFQVNPANSMWLRAQKGTPPHVQVMRVSHLWHDDIIKWKHFPRYWPFVQGIQRSPVNSPHKGQWRGALMFYLICALNKRLSKHSWGWWFKTPSLPLWRHYDKIPTILPDGNNFDVVTSMKYRCDSTHADGTSVAPNQQSQPTSTRGHPAIP